jgi:hypothetical protein
MNWNRPAKWRGRLGISDFVDILGFNTRGEMKGGRDCMRGDGDGAPSGGEVDSGGGFLEGDTVEDGTAARRRRLA